MKNIKYVIILFLALFIGVQVKAEEACYLCDELGQFSYKWSASNPSLKCNITDKTKEECEKGVPKASCYVCGGTSNSTYHWGTENPDSNRCSIDLSKNQSNCKGSSNQNGTSDTPGEYIQPTDPDNSNVDEADIDAASYIACGSINDIPEALPRFVRNLVNVLKISIPILIIILGMLDFAKTVTFTGDPKDPPVKKFIRRLVVGVGAFFIVALVQFVFGSIKDSQENILACVSCFISSEDSCTAAGENQILVASSCKNLCSKTEDPNDSASVDACMDDCETKIDECEKTYKTCKDEKKSDCKKEYSTCKSDTYTYEKATLPHKKK